MPNTAKARSLRKNPTKAEKRLWKILRDRRFVGYKFRRQHPAAPYVLDFFCHSAQLDIELDGFGHGHPKQQQADKERDDYLAKLGIRTIRFWNRQLRENERSVRDTILRELNERDPTNPNADASVS